MSSRDSISVFLFIFFVLLWSFEKESEKSDCGSGVVVAAQQLSETWVWRSHPLHSHGPPKVSSNSFNQNTNYYFSIIYKFIL